MNTTAPASGLQTVVDVIVAPKAAFERLRTTPTWGWAFVIAIVVATIGGFLISPAVAHGIQANWPTMMAQNPRLAAMSPDEQQRAMQVAVNIARFLWILTPIFVAIAILVAAVIMLIFNAIGRGSASFASLWAVSANVAVPTVALSNIVLGIIAIARGAQSFDSTEAVSGALPSLAMLVPGAGVKLFAFLAAINVFNIWGAALVYLAMRTTARVAAISAVLTALVMLIVPGLLAAAGAR